jgi:hypothetical protein
MFNWICQRVHFVLQIYDYLEACSWRQDSRRCYPGTCADETVGSCKCLDGFGGHHCETSKS